MVHEQIEAAVWGAVIGTTLGAPFENAQPFRRPSFYEPVPQRMTANADLDAWWLYASRWKVDARPSDVSRWLSASWDSHDDAAAYARANVVLGFESPASGSWNNPLSESCSSLLRCAFWGTVFTETPLSAADWAFMDSGWDHSGDGVSIAVALTIALSQTKQGDEPTMFVRRTMEALPPDCSVHAVIKSLLARVGQPTAVHDALSATKSAYADQRHAGAALAILFASILNASDTATAMCNAASCGGSSTVTTGLTGLIASHLWGVPADWRDILGESYVATSVLRDVDPPTTIGSLVDQMVNMNKLSTLPTPVSLEVEEAPPPLPAVSLRRDPGHRQVLCTGTLHIEFDYLDSPSVSTTTTTNGALVLTNNSPWDVDVDVSLDAPPGLRVNTRVSTLRLHKGERTQHGFVVNATGLDDTLLNLKVNENKLAVPFVPMQHWFAAGPFADDDGQSFTRTYPPERQQKLHDPFAGRSGLGVRWQTLHVSSRQLDVEPLFQLGPGVAFLYAKLRLPQPGRYKVLAAGAPGVLVFIDGQKIVAYLDEHEPVPRMRPPYIGDFEAQDVTTVLIKLIRGRSPTKPLSLVFFDRAGQVVEPVEFLNMDE